MNTLELNNVCKNYDKFVAVDNLSFTIAPGTMFGLLGPNGAGKTSTIRMMMGITYPDSGSVSMFGGPFERKLLERVGYLPEERGLYPKMKVEEQLIFLGQTHGLSAAEAKRRSLIWGERLEIAPHFQKKTNELSKGMQQKIQFIATLMHDPEFIIMDEPFAGLDPVNSKLLEDVLLDLNRKGRTVLFSSHRMDQVEKLCDSICLVNRGKAVLQGDLKAVKGRYGKNTVQIAFEETGDLDTEFLKNNANVQKLDHYEGHIQLVLAPGSDPQPLLREMVGRSRLSRFEVMEPSLEEIFIDVVGKTNV
ncbi:MAG TPA: ATP-binding cassette domain-containing protein [Terriglobales bacterium]|nr:ATP-binding cassette domain-containing protein [Terriglobales bacterium]